MLNAFKSERQTSATSDALHQRPVYAKDGWVWVYISMLTTRQGSKSGDADTDAQAL